MGAARFIVLLLVIFAAVAVEAFVSRPASRNRLSRLHFWGEERSHQEIEAFVLERLANVDHDDGLTERVQVVSAEPPLVIIHDFLSESQCDEVIQAALDSGRMERSTTANSQQVSVSRTSSTTWLRDEECSFPLRLIAEKVAAITGLPPGFQENLQACRYQTGQEFSLHTDHQDSFNDLECRGRLATCLLYLAEPKSGGETWFPGVENGVKIASTRGSAVFFWNTVEKPGSKDYSPEMFLNQDNRMRHAGLPIIKGEKWICNRWIHPIEFQAGVRGLQPVAATAAV